MYGCPSGKNITLRVCIAPVEIAGIASALVVGLRRLDVEAKLVLSAEHGFEYANNGSSSFLESLWRKIGAVRNSTPSNRLIKKIVVISLHNLCGFFLLLRVVCNFDAFIFVFGRTFSNTSFDLWLIKKLKKKIIFIYVGSEARPPYLDGARFPGCASAVSPPVKRLFRSVLATKRRVRLHEKYADYIVNAPGTAQFQEKPYINWFDIGIPRVVPQEILEVDQGGAGAKSLRILHSPSNSSVKGTSKIIEIIESLSLKGHRFEFIKLEGLPNKRVLEELECCDFIVDQLYSDTPLAGFAMEAAFFGKPAVVAGYFADFVSQHLPPKSVPPSLFVVPDELEGAIERMILDTEFRRDLGERARAFVTTHWSLAAVSDRYLRLLNDDVPQHWWALPGEVGYVGGCGLPKSRIINMISSLVDEYGVGALQLTDKPNLEAACLDMAQLKISK